MSSEYMELQNQKALDYFVQTPVTPQMVFYLARMAAAVIRCEDTGSSRFLPTPPTTPPLAGVTQAAFDSILLPLEGFITLIVKKFSVQVPALIQTIVYLARLQNRLSPVVRGGCYTPHCIFLASLVVATKHLNDFLHSIGSWASFFFDLEVPIFGITPDEVKLMEKELLILLNWDLSITKKNLFLHLEPFLAPIRTKLRERSENKQQAKFREQKLTQQLLLGNFLFDSAPHPTIQSTIPIQRLIGTSRSQNRPTHLNESLIDMFHDERNEVLRHLVAAAMIFDTRKPCNILKFPILETTWDYKVLYPPKYWPSPGLVPKLY